MTTSELIECLENAGFKVSESVEQIVAQKNGINLNFSKSISPDSDWAKAFSLLTSYYQTPLDERESKKKYRVRLKGFNQGRHQYLSTDSNPYMGQIFASTWDPCYKQVFTKDELNAIRNRPQFKSIVWFNELIRDGLEEFKRTDND